MAPLKENLSALLKKHHHGKANQVTIHELARELFPIRATLADIRQTIEELWLEDVPLVITHATPPGIYYAAEEEWNDWIQELYNETIQHPC